MFVCESYRAGFAAVPRKWRRPISDRSSIVGIGPKFSEGVKVQLSNKRRKFGVLEVKGQDILVRRSIIDKKKKQTSTIV